MAGAETTWFTEAANEVKSSRVRGQRTPPDKGHRHVDVERIMPWFGGWDAAHRWQWSNLKIGLLSKQRQWVRKGRQQKERKEGSQLSPCTPILPAAEKHLTKYLVRMTTSRSVAAASTTLFRRRLNAAVLGAVFLPLGAAFSPPSALPLRRIPPLAVSHRAPVGGRLARLYFPHLRMMSGTPPPSGVAAGNHVFAEAGRFSPYLIDTAPGAVPIDAIAAKDYDKWLASQVIRRHTSSPT